MASFRGESAGQFAKQVAFVDAVPAELDAIQVNDGDVVFVGGQPRLVARRCDVDDFQIELDAPAHALDDVHRGVAQGAVGLGEER